jgi:hypothetical protein
VLLYTCKAADGGTADACTDAGQAALEALYARWPNSPVCDYAPGTQGTPVIARFDDLATPYMALVWDVTLPLQTLDETALFDFYARQAEQFNPEKLCAAPTPTPGPTPTAGPATPTPAASPESSPAASPATPAASSAPSPG